MVSQKVAMVSCPLLWVGHISSVLSSSWESRQSPGFWMHHCCVIWSALTPLLTSLSLWLTIPW